MEIAWKKPSSVRPGPAPQPTVTSAFYPLGEGVRRQPLPLPEQSIKAKASAVSVSGPFRVASVGVPGNLVVGGKA